MTKFLSIFAIAAFLMVGGISTASAHCGVCEASVSKSGEMKPCTKCMDTGKTCNCGKKKHKGHKKPHHAKHDNKVVPCKTCAESERKFEEAKTGTNLNSNIGSLKIESRGQVDTGFND